MQPETLDGWLDTWVVEAATRDLPRDGAYWNAAYDWGHRRGNERPPAYPPSRLERIARPDRTAKGPWTGTETLKVSAPVELDDPRCYLQRILKVDVPTEICASVASNGPSNVALRAVDLLWSTSTQDGSLKWELELDLKDFPIPVQVAATEIVPSLWVQSLASQSCVVNAMSVDARTTDASLLTLTLPEFSVQPNDS